ncbi:MAG: hypothetical protein KatS3mg023_3462 [Armatimonadota bacterium]|nr:MAG: hypothetical protein KatS3mg023_3462 [Armatimonadota bacterium]
MSTSCPTRQGTVDIEHTNPTDGKPTHKEVTT